MDLNYLSHCLKEKFRSAKESGALIFQAESARHTQVLEIVEEATYNFDLTLLSSLQHRPEAGNANENPFSKAEPELTIMQTYGNKNEFRLILNKFPVAENHFMMVTRRFRSQDSPLSPSELHASFKILDNLRSSDESSRWFAFYNCGPESGASQAHKHVQFLTLPKGHPDFYLPLAQNSEPFKPGQTCEPLQDPNLPYAHFVVPLPESSTVDDEMLAILFTSLLQKTLTALAEEELSNVSYNFCLTTSYMMMVPRTKSKYRCTVGINSCGYMGLILCKNHEIYEEVKKHGIFNILEKVGCSSRYGQVSSEYHY